MNNHPFNSQTALEERLFKNYFSLCLEIEIAMQLFALVCTARF